MKRKSNRFFKSTHLLMMLVLCLPLFSQQTPIKAVPVTANLFLVTGLQGAGNVAFLVNPAGVLVVDSGTSPTQGQAIVNTIREQTQQPIKYLVLTHYHGDHSFGLQSFPQETIIIGQMNIINNIKTFAKADYKDTLEKRYPEYIANLRKNVEKQKKEKGGDLKKAEADLQNAEQQFAEFQKLKFIYPAVTYDKKMTVWLGDEPVEIIHPGPAHTSCNSLVYFPKQKTIHMGDILFYQHFPYIDWKAGSNTKNWIEQLNGLQTWEIDKVIPGHGELTDKQALKEQASYLTDLNQEVESALKKGENLEEMKKSITMPSWKKLKWPDLLVRNIEAVSHEISQREKLKSEKTPAN